MADLKKVFIEGVDHSLTTMFEEEGFIVVDDLEDADLLCLEGGADVNPAMYGEENTASHFSNKKDIESFGLANMAQYVYNIPIVGICRGSQVLSVLNGGKLEQHIDGHALYAGHQLEYNGRSYHVSSAHHQEAIPNCEEGQVLRAPDGTVEVHMYPDVRHLAFQPHPEYHAKGHECRELFFGLLDNVCFGKQSD